MAEGYLLPGREYAQRIAYGTSGNANGRQEYIGEGPAGTLDTDARWRIRKLTYDSSGRMTSVTWADGDAKFNKVWDDRATAYTYA